MTIEVTHEMGGSMESQRIGIYPNHLIFSSLDLNYSWKQKVKVKEEPQIGSLKIGRKIILNYIFSESVCSVQEVTDGVITSDWTEIEVITKISD